MVGFNCAIKGSDQVETHSLSGTSMLVIPQTAGTRVVIMDNHFNPTVSSQCVSRAHRYGQDKPVHCYRLAIEGTLESKVYARSENKSSVASGVIDGEYKAQNYTKAETEDLTRIDTLLTCAVCQKKRRLPPGKCRTRNHCCFVG
jgi:hypothetical protein